MLMVRLLLQNLCSAARTLLTKHSRQMMVTSHYFSTLQAVSLKEALDLTRTNPTRGGTPSDILYKCNHQLSVPTAVNLKTDNKAG